MSIKKNPKIVWAETTVIEALTPYVEQLLQCIAQVTGHPGMAHAFVSDESTISNFLDSELTGETYNDPRFDKPISLATCDTPENHRIVAEISKQLDVPVKIYDYVYEVAIRLRDKF